MAAALRCVAAPRPAALRSRAPPLPSHRAALHAHPCTARRIRASPRPCRSCRVLVAASAAVAPGEPAALAALAAVAAAAWHLERRTAFGRQVSAPLLAMGLAATAVSLTPHAASAPIAAAVARVWDGVVPFALALQLLGADLRQLARSRDAVAAFCCAAAGTAAGTAAAFAACARWVGPDAWQLAACLCASYIGGSVNFAATASALGMSANASGRALIAAAMALDNLMMALFLAVLLAWPAANVAPPELPRRNKALSSSSTAAAVIDAPASLAAPALRWAGACCIAAACCCAAAAAASALRLPGSFLALVAVFAAAASAAASALARRPAAALLGADAADAAPAALLLLFFAALGASAGPAAAASVGPAAAAFIAVQLSTHLAVTLALGAALRLPRQLLLLASNAAVGGPATAAAMAAARGWPHLAPVAVLLGTLGYVIGTAAGVAAGGALRSWQNAGTMLL